jgi:2-oxoisovalerate dehydrogenase E1 component alpha subunit
MIRVAMLRTRKLLSSSTGELWQKTFIPSRAFLKRSLSSSTTLLSSPSATASAASAASPSFGVYTGGKRIEYVSSLNFNAPEGNQTIPCFRVMDEKGQIRPDAQDPNLSEELCVRMYTTMLRLQVMDNIFYDSQRQGRISFYMTNSGEEATHIGSASVLKDDDVIFAQYREAGVLMWRGFTLQQFADHCFSNKDDGGKGRQMPVHYGSAQHNFQTISSPLCTQVPQATGAGYALKLEGKGRVVVCYFGEGAASEGDFHAGMNMATTQETPTIFFCRNNGYAISTPVWEQYRGDGIAARGIAYGMHTIRVDGNDLWAVYEATKAARNIALGLDGTNKIKPVLIEAMTYRESHHSTSDDSTRYRSVDEINSWRTTANPVLRLRLYLENKGWWDEEKEKNTIAAAKTEVLSALKNAENKPRTAVGELFTDVYGDKELPENLRRQKEELETHMKENNLR